MPKEKFLLVSLEESKAKRLAQVITNDTSRRILDHLAERQDATESQMAKDLGIPLPTVHYNLKALVDARLVEAKEFHYSPKGKEVLHYTLANRYIIIAPKGAAAGIRDKLKSLLPAVGIVGAVGYAYQLLSRSALAREAGTASAKMAAEAAPMIAGEAERYAADAAMEEAPQMALRAADAAPAMTLPDPATTAEPNYALWLVAGAAAVVVLYLLIDALRKRWRG
jgi:DNA-binding transcriptional ArsR family regulator